IDAGNPNDPTPPGAGRVDIGYVETGQAAYFADDSYCATCLNDGLEWGVDAFAKIQDALNAARAALTALNCGAGSSGLCALQFVVGVGSGTYNEAVSVPSYVRLLGSGADTTTINANGATNAVSFNGVIRAELNGFTVTGASGAGVNVANGSNTVTITRNLIRNNGHGVAFGGGSSGNVLFNTITDNTGDGVRSDGAATWLNLRDNLIVNQSSAGIRSLNGGQIYSEYNLYNNNTGGNAVGVATNQFTDILNQSPQFQAASYHLQATSPALDKADPNATVPVGGGTRADMGYQELTATPLILLFGQEGVSCAVGNSGVQSVQVGLVGPLVDLTQPVTSTLPSSWSPATLATAGQTASYWTRSVTPGSQGYYRVYTRATDAAGNQETNTSAWYDGAFYADGTAPSVSLITPASSLSTTQAAVELVGEVANYTDARTAQTVFFELVQGQTTTTVPADWTTVSFTSGQPRRFRAMVTPAVGVYTVRAAATDKAGNKGTSAGRSLTINAPAPKTLTPSHVVTFIDPTDTSFTNQATPIVRGAVRFASANGTGSVAVQVNGGAVVNATLDDPLAAVTTWSAQVSLNSGANTVSATATNASGTGPATTINVTREGTAPSLTLPTISGPVPGTVTLTGAASDDGSGLASVEVSFDGGQVWLLADLLPGVGATPGTFHSWSLYWTAPPFIEYTTYPVRVRARDNAGNENVQSLNLVVDNVPPTGITPVTFSTPPGNLDQPQSVTVNWTAPQDRGGSPTVLFDVDQASSTVATTSVGGTSANANFNASGQWYIHLSVRDTAGNRRDFHFGPWTVGSFENTALQCSVRQQTITVDGFVDTSGKEWRDDRERLDDDERLTSHYTDPQTESVLAQKQTLYATWDGTAFYLGWQGAAWALDGTLWAYLSTGAGGTNQPISPLVVGNLPFAANLAVKVESPSSATYYTYTGGQWVALGTPTFANGDSAGTEVIIPWSIGSVSEARLVAFATGEGSNDNRPWAVFPTTNPVAGPWTAYYDWTNLCATFSPASNQPVAATVDLSLSSPQDSNTAWGPSQTLNYVVSLTNKEDSALSGLTLSVATTTGLTYQSVTGGTCAGCPGTSLSVGPLSLAIGETKTVTVSGQLGNAAALSALQAVTTTVTLGGGAIGTANLHHRVDGQPPTVAFVFPETTVRSGAIEFLGTSNDGAGSGVTSVQLRPFGGSFSPAAGTVFWSGTLTVPSAADGTTFSAEAQATDARGNTSAIVKRDLTVDNTAPSVTFNLPTLLGSPTFVLNGTAYDPFPAGGKVVKVEVQVLGPNDNASTAPWLLAEGPFPSALDGSQAWSLVWGVPKVNGVAYQWRARATDAAGNVSQPTAFQPATVYASATDLQITKTDGQTEAIPGTVITYTIVASNKGPNPVTNARIQDTAPASLVNVHWICEAATDASCASNISGTGNIDAKVLLPVSRAVTFTVSALIPPALRGGLQNTATVTTPVELSDRLAINNSATDTNTLTPRTDLVITQVAQPNPAVAGLPLTYTLTITNNGPSTANGVVVTDSLPSGVTLLSAPGCTGTTNLTCALGTLQPHVPVTIAIHVFVDPSRRGSLVNTAGVSGTETDPVPANNINTMTTTVIARSDLVVSQSFSPQPVVKFIPFTMSLVVTNNGPSTATGVTLIDTLPAPIQFQSVSSSQGSCSGSPLSQTVTCNLGTLGVGASATVSLIVASNLEGTFNNQITALAVEPDPVTANNSASGPVIVVLRQPTATPVGAATVTPTRTPTPTQTTVPVTPTPTRTLVPRPPVKPALFRAGSWFLRNTFSSGPADTVVSYGFPSDIPLMCDWDGNGTRTLGVYRPATSAFYLRNSTTGGVSDLALLFGLPSDIPVCGDWDGDGVQTVGVFRPSTAALYLRNSNTSGPADLVFLYGVPGDVFVAGDWNGDGIDTVGVVRETGDYLVWYLKNSNSNGPADVFYFYGLKGDVPKAGDWDGNGSDTAGVYRNGLWYLRNSHSGGIADQSLLYGGDLLDRPLVWR
ncbi:MAG: DUF11 domain-containing protein, partial [Anaerolineae bacterium]|nr:DUF11 domain-containing protein [Anaerolineae bacterium]